MEKKEKAENGANMDVDKQNDMPEEMTRLRTMLNALGVKWVDNSTKYPIIDDIDMNIYRTYYDYKGSSYSVICGAATYGGDEGLLEVWIDREGDPTGWHTADDVLAMMGYRKAVFNRVVAMLGQRIKEIKEGVLHE